ncbi:MAG: GGDEF domain-containing protein [Solirubrobacteraceae bacterium]|jgi:diguanylate cyclase (GGDEF)-like protein
MGLSRSIAAGRAHRLRFALLANVAPVAIAAAFGYSPHRLAMLAMLAGAFGACSTAVALALVPRRRKLARGSLACMGIVCLTLMQAGTGGASSSYSMLIVTAMLWLGLQADTRELAAGIAVFAACCFAPMLLVGAPAYPVVPGRAALLALVGCTVAGSLRSICHEMDALAQRLEREAVVDDLTGLLNRRGWGRESQRELARAARTGDPIALVAIDLDHLKAINDTGGHDEGDRVLRQTGVRMRAAFRAGDVVARIGGDEFVALLTNTSAAAARRAIARLRSVTPADSAFSVGVAIWDRDENLQRLMLRADHALYTAKANGGNVTELAGAPSPSPVAVA